MPGFDQRGPLGGGPMTGRKWGKCINKSDDSLSNMKQKNGEDRKPQSIAGFTPLYPSLRNRRRGQNRVGNGLKGNSNRSINIKKP